MFCTGRLERFSIRKVMLMSPGATIMAGWTVKSMCSAGWGASSAHVPGVASAHSARSAPARADIRRQFAIQRTIPRAPFPVHSDRARRARRNCMRRCPGGTRAPESTPDLSKAQTTDSILLHFAHICQGKNNIYAAKPQLLADSASEDHSIDISE